MKMNEIAHIQEIANKHTDTKPVKLLPEPVVVCLADVQREEVNWLWPKRIARGKINLIEGDPGVGKSWFTAKLSADVSKGNPFPDEDPKIRHDPADVLLLIAEDGLGDTIRPRLEDMGADLLKIKALTAVKTADGKEKIFSLSTDLEVLKRELSSRKYALLIIDPINAYLGSQTDNYNDVALRTVLSPLARLAELYGVAIICIRHLTKGSRDRAIYRGQGSIAYTAAARVVHLIGINPDDENERAIICIKNNLSRIPTALAFEIVEDSGFKWNGETSLTAEALLGANYSQENETALSEAKEYLRDTLSDGPLSAEIVINNAKKQDISERTLKRAKKAIGVDAKKEGFGKDGHWIWSLPESTKNAKPIQQANLALLSTSDHKHDYDWVTNQSGTHYRCKQCGEFPQNV